jgi:hypothetical protein
LNTTLSSILGLPIKSSGIPDISNLRLNLIYMSNELKYKFKTINPLIEPSSRGITELHETLNSFKFKENVFFTIEFIFGILHSLYNWILESGEILSLVIPVFCSYFSKINADNEKLTIPVQM